MPEVRIKSKEFCPKFYALGSDPNIIDWYRCTLFAKFCVDITIYFSRVRSDVTRCSYITQKLLQYAHILLHQRSFFKSTQYLSHNNGRKINRTCFLDFTL